MNNTMYEVERVFLALSDSTRIRLVYFLSRGEVSVNHLCESLEISQPKISRHLAYLRSMGMVKTRRDGKWIYYSLSEPKSRFCAQLIRDALVWIDSLSRQDAALPEAHQPLVNSSDEIRENMMETNTYGKTDMWKSPSDLEVYLL